VLSDAGVNSDAGHDTGAPLPDAGRPAVDGGSSGVPGFVTAATPTFTPAAGSYAAPQTVTIASTTPNAVIYYTLDGSNPTTASAIYMAPVLVSQTTTIRAMAVAINFVNSEVASATYTILIHPCCAEFVEVNPNSGLFNNLVSVGLSTVLSGDAPPPTICYTVDGSNPSCNAGVCDSTSLTYSAGFPVPVDAPPAGGAVALKAITCAVGRDNGSLTTSTYTFGVAPLSIFDASKQVAGDLGPTFSNNAGSASLDLETATNGATIRYSLATGADLPEPPDVDCTQVCRTLSGCAECAAGAACLTGPVPPLTTIKAIGCKAGYASSALRKMVYTSSGPVPTVSLAVSPDPAAFYVDNQPLTLSATPSDSTVCFTRGKNNRIDPTCSPATGACTTGPLPLGVVAGIYNGASDLTKPLASDGMTVRAVACKSGIPSPSAPLIATYQLRVAPPTFAPGSSTVTYDTVLSWSSTTPGAVYHWSSGSPSAPDVDCSTLVTGTSVFFNYPYGAPGPTEYKVIACKAGYLPSIVTSHSYQLAQ
jgi:hypothetical protein